MMEKVQLPTTPYPLATTPVYDSNAQLWAMHLRGPDDIYPAPDHATAQNWCDYVNDFVAQVGSDVEVIAAPVHWSGTAEAHAEGLPLTVSGWTLPAGHPAITKATGEDT